MVTDPQSALRYAEQWISSWNRRDLDEVLSHYAEGCVFVSPKAAVITGKGQVEGKEALRSYWTRALEKNQKLAFTFDRALFDPSARVLVIVYEATLDGVTHSRASELMHFDQQGQVVRGEAFYGAPL